MSAISIHLHKAHTHTNGHIHTNGHTCTYAEMGTHAHMQKWHTWTYSQNNGNTYTQMSTQAHTRYTQMDKHEHTHKWNHMNIHTNGHWSPPLCPTKLYTTCHDAVVLYTMTPRPLVWHEKVGSSCLSSQCASNHPSPFVRNKIISVDICYRQNIDTVHFHVASETLTLPRPLLPSSMTV